MRIFNFSLAVSPLNLKRVCLLSGVEWSDCPAKIAQLRLANNIGSETHMPDDRQLEALS